MPADRLARRRKAPAFAPTRAIDRRRLLLLAGWGLLSLTALTLAGCEKPAFDRDRGVFVLRRPEK